VSHYSLFFKVHYYYKKLNLPLSFIEKE